VLDSGTFDVFVSGDKKVSYIAGASFGELALLYNAPRAATVKATSDSVVWALDRVSFRKLIMNVTLQKRSAFFPTSPVSARAVSDSALLFPLLSRRLFEGFLEEVDLFKNLDEYERHKISDSLEIMVFDDGQVAIKQG